MGGEEEIVRIAKRLDKMVAKKSAVSGGSPPFTHRHTALQWGAGSSPTAVLFGVPIGKDPPRLPPSTRGGGARPAAHLQAVF